VIAKLKNRLWIKLCISVYKIWLINIIHGKLWVVYILSQNSVVSNLIYMIIDKKQYKYTLFLICLVFSKFILKNILYKRNKNYYYSLLFNSIILWMFEMFRYNLILKISIVSIEYLNIYLNLKYK
jgi:hypothetical protein